MKRKLGIYVHWPFCESKCPYCDFNSHVTKQQINQEEWANAYVKQIDQFLSQVTHKQYKIESIFFGGGTPSLMEPQTITTIINRISHSFNISNAEITIESNPSSIEIKKFKQFKAAGINRVSIGIQSLSDTSLKWLGRLHNVKSAINAIESANTVFDNYSFDLMYGLKDQTAESWSKELQHAISLAKNHLSVYNLTIEENTKFFHLNQEQKLSLPEPETINNLYSITQQIMEGNQFKRYEISNYTKNNMHSRHNMLYWETQDYLGIGPGACGRFTPNTGKRTATYNIKNPWKWLSTLQQSQTYKDYSKYLKEEIIDEETQIKEIIMMGMRITKGINIMDIKRRLGINLDANTNLQRRMQTLIQHNLIKKSRNYIQPTQNGLNYANGITRFLF